MKHNGPACRDAGSAAIELAVITPAVLALFALAVTAGRLGDARQALDAAAFDAARTASLARTPDTAHRQAVAAAAATLQAQGLACTHIAVAISTDGFTIPVGQPATVTATLTCQADLSDIALPGMPGHATVTATFTSPLDTYRARQTP